MYCPWLEEVDPQEDVFKEHLLGLLGSPLLSTSHEVNNLLCPMLLPFHRYIAMGLLEHD